MKKVLISPNYDISPMGLERQSIHSDYIKGVFDIGMLPMLATAPVPAISKMADEFDALILTGGGDIASELYSQTKIKSCDIPNHYRDEYELRLLSEFINRKKPIFGICRGLQLINIALGGTLIGDISDVTRERHNGGVTHLVKTTEGSKLSSIIGESSDVNSFHHQAVAELGLGLVVSAVSNSRIIEGIEHEWLPIAAVQWHPERMGDPTIYQKMLSSYLL